MMRGKTARTLLFVAMLALLGAQIDVGCGKNAYVYGPVEQKFAGQRDEVDKLIMVNGQTYLVPPTFFAQISVGDTVKFNGSTWSVVKKADGTVPAQSTP